MPRWTTLWGYFNDKPKESDGSDPDDPVNDRDYIVVRDEVETDAGVTVAELKILREAASKEVTDKASRGKNQKLEEDNGALSQDAADTSSKKKGKGYREVGQGPHLAGQSAREKIQRSRAHLER